MFFKSSWGMVDRQLPFAGEVVILKINTKWNFGGG